MFIAHVVTSYAISIVLKDIQLPLPVFTSFNWPRWLCSNTLIWRSYCWILDKMTVVGYHFFTAGFIGPRWCRIHSSTVPWDSRHLTLVVLSCTQTGYYNLEFWTSLRSKREHQSFQSFSPPVPWFIRMGVHRLGYYWWAFQLIPFERRKPTVMPKK